MMPFSPPESNLFTAASAPLKSYIVSPRLPKRVADGIVFGTGAIGYGLIEVVWRGNTHWAMLLAGGICLRLLGAAGRRMETSPVLYKCLAGGAIITGVELLFGCVCNLWLHMGIWDYSRIPLNLGGQVCLLYSVLWGALSAFGMKLERTLRHYLPCKAAENKKQAPASAAEGSAAAPTVVS